MKVQVLVCALLCVVAFAAASDAEDMLEVASFVETAADLGELQEIGTEHEGFPVPLTKKQRLTTMEPQYHGEPLGRKKYIVPEYAVPKAPKVGRRHNKNKPRVFSSHYFSPMPKPKKGGPTCKAGDKKCRRRWRRAAARRRRATGPMNSVETLEHHLVKNKGFVNPEIVANYPGGPRGDHLARKAAKRGGKPLGLPKKTLAPAPIIKFLEISSAEADEAVDTSAEAEEQGLEEADFSEEELAGREQVTVLNGPEQFFEEGFQAPDWADEEVSENAEEVAMIESADEDEEESEEESDDEDSEEGEDEEESDEESEEESDEESEEESDEEADEESEDSEEAEEVSLIEAAATADDEDEEEDESNESQEDAVDEMEENEMVAEQIDMDASEDDADQDEEVDEEEDSEDEDESEAQDEEESETEANEEAVAEMFEVDNHLNDADTLLAEVDAHITAGADSDAEADTEAEVTKGTPGSSVAAGQTWEDAQNEKLDALEAHLAAERAATPKFAAKVVAPTDLAAVDAEHQMPEFDQEEGEDAVETVAPEYAF